MLTFIIDMPYGFFLWMWISSSCSPTQLRKTNWQRWVDYENHLRNYLAVFQGHQEQYEGDKHSFVKRSKSLLHHFGKWKLKPNKDKYTEHFSPNNLEKLTEYEKKQHTRSNCKTCDVHHFPFWSLFPLWDQKENSIPLQGFHKNIKSHILKPLCHGNMKVTKRL